MKQIFRFFAVLVLSLTLCLSLALPVFALHESNNESVTFGTALNGQTLTVSDQSQTVVMTVNASKPVSLDGIGASVVYDSALKLTNIENTTESIDFADSVDTNTARIAWSKSPVEQVENVTNIAVVTFTVPANTPAGTYELGLADIELTRNYGAEVWESSASASAVLTIQPAEGTDPPVSSGNYNIALSTLTSSPTHGMSFDVDVAITHSEETETHFAAGQFNLVYDDTALTLNSITPKQKGSNMTTNSFTGETTTVKVSDFGEDKLLGSGIYTLNFTAAEPGNTTVTLSDAGFTTKENATVNDLVPAKVGTALTVNVQKKIFTVTLPEYGFGTSGSTTVTDGESFTFFITDPYYDYGTITAVMNGSSQVLQPNEDGNYTISAVTGEVIITTSKKTPRSYDVTFDGEYESGASTATYMTDYQFTLKPNKAADATKGYTYSLKSVTIDGKNYTAYTSEDGRSYTIPGKDIKGDICVTIEKTESNPAYVFVTYTGHPGSVQNPVTTVPYGSDYTLSLDKISGYQYTVTATMNGQSVEVLVNEDGTYTIKTVTGNLEITITRIVNTDGVSVDHYLTLDGANMYLIRKDATQSGLDEKYIPTYDGKAMYWSSRYNAYCYLVISDVVIDLDDEKKKIDLAELSDTVTKIEVQYNKDVNQTGKVDTADAQLVYNMYNKPTITAFTQELSIIKFLEADVVGDGTSDIVDINDAVAIVNYIVGINTAQ